MKLADALNNYYTASGKASDIGRQLALAGIAVVWIFKGDGAKQVPVQLTLPVFLFVLSLASDFLQYLYATVAWSVLHRKKEKKAAGDVSKLEEEFLAPRAINWPSLAFFYSKAALLILGYWELSKYLAGVLW